MYNLGMEKTTNQKDGFIGLPFYIFISILMSVFGGISFSAFWDIGETFYAGLSIALALVHISLYWLNLRYHLIDKWRFFYYFVQAVLIIAFTLLPHAENSSTGLSFLGSATISVIAEGLGLWGNSHRALFIGLIYAGIMIGLFSLKVEASLLLATLSQLLINGVFIILIMFVLNQQLKEREKAEELAESLEATNAKLAAYAARNESLTLQAERERMARELHDTLAQGVAGLVMQLEAIKAYQQQDQHTEAEQVVVQALSRARNTLKESRSAIEDLRNEGGDFEHTIKKLAEEFRASSSTEFQLDIQLLDEKNIPQHIQHHARRVFHEALTNIQKHSQAKNAEIGIVQHCDMLELYIKDDGVGFDVQNIPTRGHFGLQGLRERAQLTDSRYMLTSSPNEGTMIEFIFPLHKYD